MPKLRFLLALPALIFFLLLPLPAAAGTAVLLRDIADDPLANVGSSPSQLTPFKNQVAFVATPRNAPAGVWLSDGTEAGTRLIQPGCPVGNCDENPGPQIIGSVGGFLVFSVPIEGQRFKSRLWSTDGTEGGTEPLTPDDPEAYYSPFGPAAVATAQALYFQACLDAARCGIWESDGTPDGTRLLDIPSTVGAPALLGDRLYAATLDKRLLVYDTKTGSETVLGVWEGFPYLFTAVGGKVLFIAASAGRSTELWTSDGTAAGTRALTQLSASNPFAETFWIKTIGGRAYFVANDATHGFELWRSDGTPQNTKRITNFGYFDALRGLEAENLAVAGSLALFNARDSSTAPARLWTSDGRPASVAPFRNLCRPGNCDLPRSGAPLVQIGAKVFLQGENGLWSTDGTFPGTRRFLDHRCTAACLGQSVFQALQGRIIFLDKDARGIDLWSSNGNRAGNRRLSDMPDGNPLTGPVIAAAGKTFFAGRDSHGEELWTADSAGTRLLADIGSSAQSSEVPSIGALGSRAVFLACDGSERAIWTSAGTPETTEPISGTEKPCSLNFSSYALTDTGRLFYSVREPGLIDQLWTTDGGAPVQLTDFTAQTELAGLGPAAALGDLLLLPLYKAGSSFLWTSDGTPEGTREVFAMPAGQGITSSLRVAGDEAYFTSGNYTLWRTDGTAAGTRQLASDVSLSSEIERLGDVVLFSGYSPLPNGSVGDFGLWRTDGTAAGTVRLRVLPQAPFLLDMTAYQGRVYFLAADGPVWSLWRSDGTAAGTVVVKQLGDPVIDDLTPFELTVFNGRLFFAARDAAHGRELWTSDGTAAGTRMVADLFPGIDSSRPQGLTVAGGALYFSAYDAAHGTELWRSDGTAAGTHFVQDIAEDGSSAPRSLTAIGNFLYFTADDGLTGREVWSLPLP